MCWQAILIAALLCIGFALHYQFKNIDPETKTVMARMSVIWKIWAMLKSSMCHPLLTDALVALMM